MNTYKYVGDISFSKLKDHSEDKGSSVIHIRNHKNAEIPPVRLTVCGQMVDYIESITYSDDEEKYLEKEFYYDEFFRLLAIVIPCQGYYPAKVIISEAADYSPAFGAVFERGEARIYGPQDLINERQPESMSPEEYKRLRKDLDVLMVWNITELSYPTDYYETVRHQQQLIEQLEKSIAKLSRKQKKIKKILEAD